MNKLHNRSSHPKGSSRVVAMLLAVSLAMPAPMAWAQARGTDGCGNHGVACDRGSRGSSSSSSGYSSSGGYYSGAGLGAGSYDDGSAGLAVLGVMAGALLLRALFGLFDGRPSTPAPPRPAPPPSASRAAPTPVLSQRPPPGPAIPEVSTDELRQQQLRSLIAPLNNPWGSQAMAAANPWDGSVRPCSRVGGAVPAVANPWAAASPAVGNNDGYCSSLWASLTSELDGAWARSRDAYAACKQFKFGPEWNACAERTIKPAQAAVQQMIDQRSSSMNECRGWIAATKYNEIADRVEAAKSLYDHAVGTPALVAQIQDSARSLITQQHSAILGQMDTVLCGMDEISSNPWR